MSNWTPCIEKGEVFTKPEVAQFMLTVSGIFENLLHPSTRILEPSCGHGEFIVAIAKELCYQIKRHQLEPNTLLEQIKQLVTAYDISESSIAQARELTYRELLMAFSATASLEVINAWFKVGDFLIENIEDSFSHVVGNPPYIRLEKIPPSLLTTYRQRFHTMKARSDIYIAFFEKSLSLLRDEGRLCFICTDRWTKNQYGAALRSFIAKNYSLDLYVDLYGEKVFQLNVDTYPAITLLTRTQNKSRDTLVVRAPSFHSELTSAVVSSLDKNTALPSHGISVNKVVADEQPWVLATHDKLELLYRLEKDFPVLEEADCDVFIGVATGNNKVFFIDESVDIEPERKLPLVTARDIQNDTIRNSNLFLINTFDDNGLIKLENFPKLAAYLSEHENSLRSRHVAKQNPKTWYRTIDRVFPARAKAPKLLIPDIKANFTVVFDAGNFYPNNSLYYITSESWDLYALKAILTSGMGQFFIEMYSTKVMGNHLRFQAQHLRRIRIPHWQSVPKALAQKLIQAGKSNDRALAQGLVSKLYQLNEKEKLLLEFI